jgi:aspartate/methionine/tyrosine aminotransferase
MYVMGKLPDGLDLSSIDKDDNDGDDDNDDKESSIDVKFCRLLIKYYGVAAIPGSFCGLPGWIRICYANLPPAKTKVAAKRLQKGINELCGNDKNIIIAK